MKPLKTLVLASTFLAGGMLAASGQSTTSPSSPGASGSISAATHCKDAQGNVQLKTASSGSGLSGSAAGSGASGTSSTTGSASGNGASSGMSGGTSGSASGMSGSSAAAANLPAC
jgi:hypothetical protein